MIVAVRDDRRCIVVGAGLLGLSAAWALSRRHWRVTVLEAADTVGHDWSGSKGDARIFRLGYPEPVYVDMAVRARALWHDLEAASGRRLLHGRGQVTFGDDATLDAIAAALAAAGSPSERLAPGEAARRFPAIAVHGPVLFEPDSCVLAADQCVRALGDVADFVLHTGERVLSLRQGRDSVTVATASGRMLDADVVIDCAGPGALALLDDPPPVAAPPSLPQVAYFAPAPGATPEQRPPIFVEWGADMIYGLPVPDGGARGGTYKVSHHTPGTNLDGYDPTGAAPPDDDARLLALLTGAVRRLLPSLDPDPVHTERCVYDNSADADFVLARTGRIVVGCGTSGHGFKFGPLLGELLADLADGATPSVDLRPFGLRRDPAPPPRPAHQSR
jgi:sarcosine oxidase